MLNATKLSIILIIFGSVLDFTTSNVMLSMEGFFKEMNPLYYMLGAPTFNILFILMTTTVITILVVYDFQYSIKNYWLTCFGSLSIALIYGGFHLYLGLHNISIFLNVMGSV